MEHFTLHNVVCDGEHPPVEELLEDGYGRWHCVVDYAWWEQSSDSPGYPVFELHKSSAWQEGSKKAVVRVSETSSHGVRLGPCVFLDVPRMKQLRDLLDVMIVEAESGK